MIMTMMMIIIMMLDATYRLKTDSHGGGPLPFDTYDKY
jgi:hypothetical protein